MTSEQQLIQQISQVIENDQLENRGLLEDLAVQYSELCTEINQRLGQCQEYLQKGLLSEAVFEARRAPDLLGLAGLVQFEAMRKWQVICEDLDLPRVPLPQGDILEKLRQAEEREEILQPLLRQLRNSIYQGEQSQSIQILRKIREIDPENASWQKNLQTYEQAELPQWIEKANRALAGNEQEALREVYEELTHPYRIVPAPQELMKRLQRALLAEDSASCAQEAHNILKRLAEQLTAENSGEVRQLLEQVALLEKKEAFYQRPEEWQGQISHARSWLEQAEKEEKIQAEFQQELKKLQKQLITENFTEEALRHQWAHILNFEQSVPQALQEQVEKTLAGLQERRTQRKQHLTIGLSAAGVLLLVCLIYASISYGEFKQLSQIQQDLEAKYTASRFEELQAELEALKQYQPKIYENVKVQVWARQLERALSEQGEHRKAATAYLDSLEEIRRGGYALGEEEIQAVLAKAVGMPLTSQEKAKVSSWRAAYQVWKAGQRRASSGVLNQVCSQLRTAKNSFSNPETESDLEFEAQKIQDLQEAFLAALPHLERAEDLAREEFQQCQKQLEEWAVAFQQRRIQQKKQEELVRQQKRQEKELTEKLLQALPNLDRYFEQLQQLQSFYEGNLPVALKNALDQLPQHRKALMLGDSDFSGFPRLSEEMRKRLQEFVGGENVAGSVWEQDLRFCQRYFTASQRISQAFQKIILEQEQMFQVFVMRVRRRTGGEWQSVYAPQPLSSRREELKNGEGIGENSEPPTVFWGEVYYAEADEDIPIVVHTRSAFPDRLSTQNYEIEVRQLEKDRLSGQGKFLMELMMNAGNQSEPDIFLLNALERLADPNLQMDLIPRTWLQKEIIALVEELFASEIPESRQWRERFVNIDLNVPWMNPRHFKTKATEEQIREIGQFYPDLKRIKGRLQANRTLLAYALSRKISCAGALVQDENGEFKPNLTMSSPGELWVLSFSGGQTAPRWQILSKDGKNLLPEIAHSCTPYQLIFAPDSAVLPPSSSSIDGNSTRKPASWPVNDSSMSF